MFHILFQTPVPDLPTYDLGYYLALAEKYGLSVLLLGIAIVILIKLYTQQNDRFNTLFKMFLKVDEKIPPKIEESVEKVTHLTMTIRSIMKEAQFDFKPDYLHLWQFHNGVTLIGSGRIPYMYMAMTQEMILGDLEPVINQFLGIPLSFTANMITVLIDNPLLVERSNKDGTSDNPISAVMFSKGVTTQELLQIKDVDDQLVAVLEFCFIIPPEFDDSRRNSMKRYAQRIGLALASFSESNA